MKPRWSSIAIYLVLTLIWGSAFILTKKGETEFEPLEVAGIRISSACLFLMPFAIKHLKEVPRKMWPLLTLAGLLGSLIPAILFSEAQTQITSAATGILSAFTPVWALIISRFVFRVPITRLQIIGISVGFVGCVLLVLQGEKGPLDLSNWKGFLVLLATLCYGINLNIIKHKFKELKNIQVASLAVFFVGPLALGYTLMSDVPQKLVAPDTDLTAFYYVVLLGVTSTAIAVILFNQLLRQVTAVFASTITYATAIVAVLWGLLDGEMLSAGHYVAMSLTIGGIFLIRR